MKLFDYGFSKYHLLYAVEKFDSVGIKKFFKSFFEGYSLSDEAIVSRLKDGKKYNIFIHSKSNGTGKTTVLHMIALFFYNNRLKFNRPRFYFNQISSMFKGVKDDMFGGESTDLLGSLCEVDLLFLDDLDKAGKLTEFEMENLRMIIDYRYRNLKPVFISANKSLEHLLSEKIIDTAIYSRLTEVCAVVNLDGESDHRIKDNKRDIFGDV